MINSQKDIENKRSINNILGDLEKLTDFLLSGENNPRKNLAICQNCHLNESDYSLVFYRKELLKQKPFPLVFISRDPNLKVEKEVSSTNQAIINLKTPPPKKGLGWFFNDFLTINCLWSRFLEFLKNPNNESRFYWTHLVKCYAKNSQEEVQKAKNFCKNYLSEELKQLDPKLIIGAGLDVARVLVEIGYLQANKDNLRFENLQPINEKTLEGRERIIIIPHPSQSPYQTWKNGCFKIGITHKELTELIKKVVSDNTNCPQAVSGEIIL